MYTYMYVCFLFFGFFFHFFFCCFYFRRAEAEAAAAAVAAAVGGGAGAATGASAATGGVDGVLDTKIHMWSACKKCGRLTTPLVLMSEDTWKFSLGKFLEVCVFVCCLHIQQNRPDLCAVPSDVRTAESSEGYPLISVPLTHPRGSS